MTDTEAAQRRVRLTEAEIAAVRAAVRMYFGAEAEVRVFGSRADPVKRGGDLDLHVLVPGDPPPIAVESRAIDVIERALDDLHVDLLVLGRDQPRRRIDEVALATGVLLGTTASRPACGTRWLPPRASRSACGGRWKPCGRMFPSTRRPSRGWRPRSRT